MNAIGVWCANQAAQRAPEGSTSLGMRGELQDLCGGIVDALGLPRRIMLAAVLGGLTVRR
jgi:hypothetical protein